jgi:hypothetical protein
MIGLLLVLLLLVLLFGGLGLAVSPLFFLLVIILILAMGRRWLLQAGALVGLNAQAHSRREQQSRMNRFTVQ